MQMFENPSGPEGVGKLYTWEKDKYFRYIKCNENYAMAAGLDSPHSIIGKTDDQMPWRSLADDFRTGDQLVISGGGERLFVHEKEIMVDRVADILVNEGQLLNSAEECIGVSGFFVDITGHVLVKKSTATFDESTNRLKLPDELGGGYITPTEARVLEKVAAGWTSARIADEFCNSVRTIEQHVARLKKELQCSSKADLVTIAQKHGLQFTLHEIGALLERR